MSRDSRSLPVKPRDDYKLWSPQPDPATIKPCPICSKRAEVWQYAAKPDSQLLRVVMCTNGEAFGPQVRDGGSLFSGCMLYMPPDDFYRATTKEAVRYWNEYAEAIAAQRSESAVPEGMVLVSLEAAKAAWSIAHERRDEAMQADILAAEAQKHLDVLAAGGFAKHLPTFEEVKAAWNADVSGERDERAATQKGKP